MKLTKEKLKEIIKEELGGMQEAHGAGSTPELAAGLDPEIYDMVQTLAFKLAGMTTSVPSHAPSMASTHVDPDFRDIEHAILNAIEPYVGATPEHPEI